MSDSEDYSSDDEDNPYSGIDFETREGPDGELQDYCLASDAVIDIDSRHVRSDMKIDTDSKKTSYWIIGEVDYDSLKIELGRFIDFNKHQRLTVESDGIIMAKMPSGDEEAVGEVRMHTYPPFMTTQDIRKINSDSRKALNEQNSTYAEELIEYLQNRKPRNYGSRISAGDEQLKYLEKALLSADSVGRKPARVLVVHNGPADLVELEETLGIPESAFDAMVDTSDMAETLGISMQKHCQISLVNLVQEKFDGTTEYMHNAGNDAAYGPFCVLHLVSDHMRRQGKSFSSLDLSKCPLVLIGWDVEWRVHRDDIHKVIFKKAKVPEKSLTEGGITTLAVSDLASKGNQISQSSVFSLQKSEHIVIESEMDKYDTFLEGILIRKSKAKAMKQAGAKGSVAAIEKTIARPRMAEITEHRVRKKFQHGDPLPAHVKSFGEKKNSYLLSLDELSQKLRAFLDIPATVKSDDVMLSADPVGPLTSEEDADAVKALNDDRMDLDTVAEPEDKVLSADSVGPPLLDRDAPMEEAPDENFQALNDTVDAPNDTMGASNNNLESPAGNVAAGNAPQNPDDFLFDPITKRCKHSQRKQKRVADLGEQEWCSRCDSPKNEVFFCVDCENKYCAECYVEVCYHMSNKRRDRKPCINCGNKKNVYLCTACRGKWCEPCLKEVTNHANSRKKTVARSAGGAKPRGFGHVEFQDGKM